MSYIDDTFKALVGGFKGRYLQCGDDNTLRRWLPGGRCASQEVVWANLSQSSSYRVVREDGTSDIISPGDGIEQANYVLNQLVITAEHPDNPCRFGGLVAIVCTTIKNTTISSERKRLRNDPVDKYNGVNTKRLIDEPSEYHQLFEFIPITQEEWDVNAYYWFKDGRCCIVKYDVNVDFKSEEVTFPSVDYQQVVKWATTRARQIKAELYFEFVNVVVDKDAEATKYYINRNGLVHSIVPTVTVGEELGVYVQYATLPSKIPKAIRDKGVLVSEADNRWRYKLEDCLYNPDGSMDEVYPFILYKSERDAENDEYNNQLRRFLDLQKRNEIRDKELVIEEVRVDKAKQADELDHNKLIRKDAADSRSTARKNDAEDVKQVGLILAGLTTVIGCAVAFTKILSTVATFSMGFGFLGLLL